MLLTVLRGVGLVGPARPDGGAWSPVAHVSRQSSSAVPQATFSHVEISARTLRGGRGLRRSRGQDRVGHADVPTTEVVESAHPVSGIARDEQCPFLPDRGEGPLDRRFFDTDTLSSEQKKP